MKIRAMYLPGLLTLLIILSGFAFVPVDSAATVGEGSCSVLEGTCCACLETQLDEEFLLGGIANSGEICGSVHHNGISSCTFEWCDPEESSDCEYN